MEFKVGDRVRVYSNNFPPYFDASVLRVFDNLLEVSPGTFQTKLVHPKQCRRLKPKAKKKPVPREVWVNVNDGDLAFIYKSKEKADDKGQPNRIGGKAWRYVLAKKQD